MPEGASLLDVLRTLGALDPREVLLLEISDSLGEGVGEACLDACLLTTVGTAGLKASAGGAAIEFSDLLDCTT